MFTDNQNFKFIEIEYSYNRSFVIIAVEMKATVLIFLAVVVAESEGKILFFY